MRPPRLGLRCLPVRFDRHSVSRPGAAAGAALSDRAGAREHGTIPPAHEQCCRLAGQLRADIGPDPLPPTARQPSSQLNGLPVGTSGDNGAADATPLLSRTPPGRHRFGTASFRAGVYHRAICRGIPLGRSRDNKDVTLDTGACLAPRARACCACAASVIASAEATQGMTRIPRPSPVL
jgi:hypothetical protein